MTAEERAYNYASTQKPTKLQVGEIAKHYNEGYNQALKDIQDQAEKSVIEKSNGEVTIEDLVAYNQGFKTGRELAMQDFMEKAEKWLEPTFKSIAGYNCGGDLMNDFKNYMQDESN